MVVLRYRFQRDTALLFDLLGIGAVLSRRQIDYCSLSFRPMFWHMDLVRQQNNSPQKVVLEVKTLRQLSIDSLKETDKLTMPARLGFRGLFVSIDH